MKMHALYYIVKEGFAVIVAFCYDICVFKNPVIMILKVVGCEDCVQENKLPLWGPGGEATSRWAVLQFFSEKNSHFNTIWMAF